MSIFHRESTWDRLTKPLVHASAHSLVRSGITAGATVVAISAASAATSALRRRAEQS